MIFLECFAGAGVLSKAVERVGFQVAPPQDLASGGIDFEDDAQVLSLWGYWASLREAGFMLAFHFAPPVQRSQQYVTEASALDCAHVSTRRAWTRAKPRQQQGTAQPETPRCLSATW